MPRLAALFAGLVALTVTAVTEAADSYPSKPLRMVITFPAGGPSDVVVRLVTQRMTEEWGHPVIIDNRGGAGGIVGTEVVAHAPPDGYTFLVGTAGGMTINPALHAKLSYDPFRDFAPVGMLVMNPQILIAHPSVPAKSVKELVAWIKSQKEAVNYGSGGIGSIGHIIGEVFKNEHKLSMEHIGYKGSGPMHTDLIGGRLKFAIDTLPQNVPYMQDNRLRAVAVTSPKRAGISPEVPTVIEAGQPKLVAENFLGLSAPAGIDAGIANRFHAVMAEVLADPVVNKRLEDIGVYGRKMSVAEFNGFVAKQVADWAPLVKASGAKLN